MVSRIAASHGDSLELGIGSGQDLGTLVETLDASHGVEGLGRRDRTAGSAQFAGHTVVSALPVHAGTSVLVGQLEPYTDERRSAPVGKRHCAHSWWRHRVSAPTMGAASLRRLIASVYVPEM